MKSAMNIELTRMDIGTRIAALRKQKGLSQADLARRLKISRPSVAQIELGNRNLDALELQRLSLILSFSLDEFMSENFSVSGAAEMIHQSEKALTKERVSTPTLQLNKFKNVLLYLLESCAGKPNIGEIELYKLLYFSDFNYYELYEEHLTGAKYRKLPFGPVPEKLDTIINQMIVDGHLQRVKTTYFGLPQTRFLPLTKPKLTELKASEIAVIDSVVEQMSDWSAAAISNYAHKDMPWLASKDGQLINYELAFYRELPFSVRNYSEDIEDQ
ncbi:MAG: DUF4065 domain-containing protein [Bacteroidales bacterium]|nr:DUF4065 domain-containing protein [Bacteroidales bacterium]